MKNKTQVSVQDLSNLIEVVREAVDQSKLGPLVQIQGEKKVVSQIALSVFNSILSGLLYKLDSIDIVPHETYVEDVPSIITDLNNSDT